MASMLRRNHDSPKKGMDFCIAYLMNQRNVLSKGEQMVISESRIPIALKYASKFKNPEKAHMEMWQEGVAGILISAIFENWPGEKKHLGSIFPWDKYAVVKTTRIYSNPQCPIVRHDPFQYMITLIRNVLDRGYRRLAFCLFPSSVSSDDEARWAALWYMQKTHGTSAKFFTRNVRDWAYDSLPPEDATWLQQVEPDVIIIYHWKQVYALQKSGYVFPGPIGLAAVLAHDSVVPNTPAVSGCGVQQRYLLETALKILEEDIAHRRLANRGLPAPETVISPKWVEGETLPGK